MQLTGNKLRFNPLAPLNKSWPFEIISSINRRVLRSLDNQWRNVFAGWRARDEGSLVANARVLIALLGIVRVAARLRCNARF
jgi:hypothetical protein